jgi:hypothetical protein
MAIPCTNELELPSSSGSIYSKSMVGRETRSSLGCLSEGSGAASQSVADQKRRGSRTKFVNCGTASSSEGRYWLPTYKASRFQGYKVGIRSARHIHTSPVSYVCRRSFPQCSCRNTSTFSAIEIEFRICFRVPAGRKTAEVSLQNI